MAKQKTVIMKVKIKTPDGCIDEDVEEYVKDAIQTWCKQYNPGSKDEEEDPRFDLDRHIISIERVTR